MVDILWCFSFGFVVCVVFYECTQKVTTMAKSENG